MAFNDLLLLLVIWKDIRLSRYLPEPAITCSKLTIETLEKGIKYVQS